MGFVGRGCCKVGEVYRWGVVGTGATPKERRKHAISRLALLAPVKTNKLLNSVAVAVSAALPDRQQYCKTILNDTK